MLFLWNLIWTRNLEPEACLSATKSGVQLLATQKKSNKEAELMERKVCFILDAGPKANSCPDNQRSMAPYSSTLAWKIPWTEEPGRLQSLGSRRVGHDWENSLSLFTFMHWRRKWQPSPVFLPEESQGRGSLVGCRLWGHTESDTTEWLHFHFHFEHLSVCVGNPGTNSLQIQRVNCTDTCYNMDEPRKH